MPTSIPSHFGSSAQFHFVLMRPMDFRTVCVSRYLVRPAFERRVSIYTVLAAIIADHERDWRALGMGLKQSSKNHSVPHLGLVNVEPAAIPGWKPFQEVF
jgi:hypothetical protein